MKRKDDLYQLIRSMSAAEKGYFKKYSAGGEKEYILLFDEIEKAEHTDDKLLKGKFGAHFSRLKNYLYKAVLRSLTQFHTEKNISLTLFEQLSWAKILITKGLLHQAYELVLDLKEKAAERELFALQLSIADTEVHVLRLLMQNDRAYETSLQKAAEAQKCLLDMMRNALEYRALYRLVYSKTSTSGNGARTEADLNIADELLQHPLLKDESKALSLSAKNMLYAALADLAHFKKDRWGAYRYQKKLVEISSPFTPVETKLVVLINFAHVCYSLEKYDEAMETIAAAKAITENHRSKAIRNYSTLSLEMMILIRQGRYREVTEMEALIANPREKGYLNEILMQKSSVGYSYFCLGEFDQAMPRYSEILANAPDVQMSNDTLNFIQILMIILHFEKGNLDLVESLVRSLYRRLRKSQRLPAFEKVMLEGLGRIIRSRDDDEQREAFLKTRENLLKLYDDEFEKEFTRDLAPLVLWLESKIQRRPFRGMMAVQPEISTGRVLKINEQ
jgi:tetratricopeptide (TPR) repeat protein